MPATRRAAERRARRLVSPPPGVSRGVVRGPDRLDPLARALRSAGSSWPARTVALGWVILPVAAGGAGAVFAGPGLALLVALTALATPAAVLVSNHGRLDRQLERALPGVLEQVGGSIRSGASLRQALGEARPPAADAGAEALGGDLASIVAEVDAGRPLVDAVEDWAERRPLASVGMVVAVFVLGSVSGGPQARAVDGLAATLRERNRLEGEVGVLAAQARASAVVIAVAPLAFAVLAAATDPASADFLVRSTAGLACLAGGLALDGVAAAWMVHIVRSAR